MDVVTIDAFLQKAWIWTASVERHEAVDFASSKTLYQTICAEKLRCRNNVVHAGVIADSVLSAVSHVC